MNFKKILFFTLILMCSAQIVNATLTNDLIAYYTFDGVLTDSTGRLNLTNNNSVSNITLYKVGSGSRDFRYSSTARVHTSSSLNNGQTYTINFWGYNVGLSGQDILWCLASSSDGAGCFEFQDWYSNNMRIQGTTGLLNYGYTSSNTWSMWTLVMNNTQSQLWLNGSNVANWSTTTTSNRYLIIGGRSSGNNYEGVIDEWGMWNRSLNSSEITTLFNNGTGLQYPFIEDSSFNVSNTILTSPIIVLTPQSLQLNISYNESINFTNATFFYNNTALGFSSKTTTSSSISNDTYVINFTTPNAVNGTIVNAYWAYNITFTNGTTSEFNTSNQPQTILNLLAGNCTDNVTTNRVLNYSVRNVETSALVSANSIFNLTLNYDNGLSQNFLLNYTGNNNPAICVYPSFILTNYTVTAALSATGYTSNNYIANGQVSNTTNNINIYMTNSSSGTAITYNVVDSSELPLSGMTVQSFQYDVGTGTLTQVNSLVTDDDGQGVAFLILNQYFVWRIYDTSNNLVLTDGPSYLPTTTTSKTFIIGGNTTTGLTDWITVYGLNCTVTNSTVPLGVTTTWNSSNANISNYCFNLFNVSGGNMNSFNQSCSTNQSGSLFLPAYNETSWLAFPTMEVNDSDTTFILWCNGESPLSFNTFNRITPLFGLEGVFWALVLLVLLVTMGFAGQGAEYISMLLIIGWTAAVGMFELIPWGYSTFIGIAAFLIVWLMGMRRER